jgi:hypothetical protein
MLTQDGDTPRPASAAEPWINAAASQRATRAAKARNASSRRRYIDPTTCERDYTADEIELMQAIQAYKQSSGRMFPTWSEVLEVIKALGYTKDAVRRSG